MAIDWAGVEAKLDEAATQARGESTIDAAIHVYNTKVIEALQLMINTAKVNGTGVVNGGAVYAMTVNVDGFEEFFLKEVAHGEEDTALAPEQCYCQTAENAAPYNY
jgi:hypothetical protein